uniref:Uncharacterized protein n=1 Tax=Arion vulgaris TaxID=1028688 RepID=A0A0B6YG42_9EUPU
MSNGRIPNDILYGQLATGTRQQVCTLLYFIDTCKHVLISFRIDNENWEWVAKDRQA